MDTAKMESWLLNDKDIPQTGTTRVAYPACLRRPRPGAPAAPYPDRDWTNPNRFSDPLNRSSRVSTSLGLSLPGRPNKAYTWYLENELPWRVTAARAKAAALEDKPPHSLFGSQSWKLANQGEEDGKRKRRNGASFTWERVRQDQARDAAIPRYNTLEPRPTARTSDRLSPHTVNTQGSGVSPQGSWNGCSAACSAYNTHLTSPRSSPSGSKRSSPSPSRHVLGNHLTSSHNSPSGSQRSSPSRSPQGTLTRLSPGLIRRYSPNLRLSPTQHSVLGTSYGSSQHRPSPTLSRASFVSQWVNSSSSSSFQLSPFSARSSQTSSSRDDGDVSYGSETDDDFFYISCKQLSQGLAGLSVTSTEPLSQPQGDCVVENPTFVLPPDDDNVDDEDDFIGCSDDALSDDVFLDNPLPSAAIKRNSQSQNSSLGGPGKDLKTTEQDDDHEGGTESVDHPAVESLRRNSLQSKLRQTWQHRRNRAAGRAVKLKRATDDCSFGARPDSPTASNSLSPSRDTCVLQSATTTNTSPSAAEDRSGVSPPEVKPCFYYVISPTDDVNMPDVIAVRRSSVELIRWQNSLRRRRRRQAKRHDLGRNKKKEPRQSATV